MERWRWEWKIAGAGMEPHALHKDGRVDDIGEDARAEKLGARRPTRPIAQRRLEAREQRRVELDELGGEIEEDLHARLGRGRVVEQLLDDVWDETGHLREGGREAVRGRELRA